MIHELDFAVNSKTWILDFPFEIESVMLADENSNILLDENDDILMDADKLSVFVESLVFESNTWQYMLSF